METPRNNPTYPPTSASISRNPYGILDVVTCIITCIRDVNDSITFNKVIVYRVISYIQKSDGDVYFMCVYFMIRP